MASPLNSAVLLLMIIALATQPVYSHDQLSTIATGLSRIINVLEEIANTTSSLSNAVSDIVATQTRIADKIDSCFQDEQITKPLPTVAMATHKPTTQSPFPRDCSEIPIPSYHGSGVYTIDPRDGQGSFDVYCDMDNAGGGWIVFQKRFDGSVDFYLGWDDYESGFGNLQGEHWLGLQKMHRLTSSGRWALRIDLVLDFAGNTRYGEYVDFQIGDAVSLYQLSIGAFNDGNIIDQLSGQNGTPFTTKDQETSPAQPCRIGSQGGWWQNTCHHSNANGEYQELEFRKSEMKMRRLR